MTDKGKAMHRIIIGAALLLLSTAPAAGVISEADFEITSASVQINFGFGHYCDNVGPDGDKAPLVMTITAVDDLAASRTFVLDSKTIGAVPFCRLAEAYFAAGLFGRELRAVLELDGSVLRVVYAVLVP